MVVYIEAALAENFLLDGILLYLVLLCARIEVRPLRLLLAALLGAGEAVLFPVLRLPAWAGSLLKVLGGILLVLAAAKCRGAKKYFMATGAFFALTFALGGMLTAACNLFGVEYSFAGGIVERAPVGLILGGCALFVIAVMRGARALYRYVRIERNILPCTLRAGRRTVRWKGFADSGNALEFRGEPVCVASAEAIFALFGREAKEAGRITLGTVNGTREAPVFECESLGVEDGKKLCVHGPVYLTVGEVPPRYQLILSTSLLEV